MIKKTWLSLVLTGIVLTACGAVDLGSLVQGPTPMPGAANTPIPSAEVLFTLNAPASTPADAEISLEIVDPVTGVGYHSDRHEMSQTGENQWQASLTIPAGSLVRYRYLLTQPNQIVETSYAGEPTRYRVAHITSSMQFTDQVAGWNITQAETPPGRIVGQILASGSREPVPEMVVTAGGLQTFTDGLGRFRLEGLPAGLHNLVAYHPDGAYQPMQQGAIVASGGTTPADFTVDPAKAVTMTFQVTVPAGTPSDQPLRMVGNLRQLGDVFTGLPGGVEISSIRAPSLVQVDETSYLLLTTMYAGTDLRYKFTLGDGIWNAERDTAGAFRTRQLIIPETDAIQSDQVERWREAGDPITLMVDVPENTPADEVMGLQLNPFTPFEPLPMVQVGDHGWQFRLWSPLSFDQSMEYQVCRNLECGRAEASHSDTIEIDPGNSFPRSIEEWSWWDGPGDPPSAATPEIVSRPEMQVGVDLAPIYRPSWVAFDRHTIEQAAALGSNNLTVTPTWIAEGTSSTPLIRFDPAHSRYRQDWLAFSSTAANHGLALSVRPELMTRTGTLSQWWQEGTRDSAWWTTTNDQLRSFLISHAKLAQDMGAQRMIINGSQLGPSLPNGQLADGRPGNPAESSWPEWIAAVRQEFAGELVYEIELAESLASPPDFLGQFDSVQIYWHAPLSETPDPTISELQAEVERYLDLQILPLVPADMPISLSIEYLSIDSAALACPERQQGGCYPAAAFDAGTAVDDRFSVDLEAQSDILNALLLEVVERDRITGVSLRRYYPLAAMQDKSASIHGKPASEVLRHWYPRLRGE
ncbi:MAG: hypothetical protein ACLFWD_04700 [Anaerolineales bacterium]